jgi:SAM-dependent methyltransferase
MRDFAKSWTYNGGDPSILLFSEALSRWPWAMTLPSGARVIDLGCCESDFTRWLLKARPDVEIVGIDVRQPDSQFKGTHIKADAASLPISSVHEHLRPSTFDAVVALGSIEHFGLGWHEYGDPSNEQGDVAAAKSMVRLLSPGGWFYYDVPWTPHDHFATGHWRCYSDMTLADRLTPSGTRPLHRGYSAADPIKWCDRRPEIFAPPFYYVARLLRKEC